MRVLASIIVLLTVCGWIAWAQPEFVRTYLGIDPFFEVHRRLAESTPPDATSVPSSDAQVGDAERTTVRSPSLPDSSSVRVNQYFEALKGNEFLKAYQLTSQYQRSVQSAEQSVKREYPQTMWAGKLKERTDDLVAQFERSNPASNLPGYELIFPTASLKLIETRRAKRFDLFGEWDANEWFFEVDYARAGKFGESPILPPRKLAKVTIRVYSDRNGFLDSISTVDGSYTWFELSEPLIIALSNWRGTGDFGEPAGIEKFNLRAIGGKPRYQLSQFVCATPVEGQIGTMIDIGSRVVHSWRDQQSRWDDRPEATSFGGGTFSWDGRIDESAGLRCTLVIQDSLGNAARALFEISPDSRGCWFLPGFQRSGYAQYRRSTSSCSSPGTLKWQSPKGPNVKE